MFVGHGAVALALVGLTAYTWGWSRERALTLGLFAFAFATIPDVDMFYALHGLLQVDTLDPFALASGFWRASTVVHRSITHSLVVALPVSVGVSLLAGRRQYRVIGLGLLAGLGILLGRGMSPASLLVFAAFLVGAAFLGLLAREFNIGIGPIFGAASVGLITHPFGDLFTGQPPALLYPLGVEVFQNRLTIAADPTLHLLGAFFVEIVAIWVGILAIARLSNVSLKTHLRPRAALGGAYGLAALVIPAPTLETSYQFVFSVLSVGFVGLVPRLDRFPGRIPTGGSWHRRVRMALLPLSADGSLLRPWTETYLGTRIRTPHLWTVLITGMGAISVGGMAYAIAYVLSRLGLSLPV
ncbi:MAG: metal-dependent hydrolase [Halodesulfurarchaeum sp.]